MSFLSEAATDDVPARKRLVLSGSTLKKVFWSMVGIIVFQCLVAFVLWSYLHDAEQQIEVQQQELEYTRNDLGACRGAMLRNDEFMNNSQ